MNMKQLFTFFTLLALMMSATAGWGQTSIQNFGILTGSHTSTTGSTSFIPNPTSGTTWARAGGGGTAPINLVTASNPLVTTGAYVRAVASSSTSVSKFSPWVGYTGSTEFYTSFKVLFGDASAGSTATSGSWTFYQGAGAMYSDANDFAAAQVFTGLRFTFGEGGALAISYRGGGSWINTGLSPNSLSSATVYTIEIVGNNKSSGTISYTYNGVAQTVAVQKFDLYVNGTKIGDDLAQAALTAGANITSGTFIGISSTSNAANIFVDDAVTYNAVPAAIGSAPTLQASNITFTAVDQSGMTANWTNGNGAKRVVIMNTSDSFTAPTDGTDPTANTVYSGSGQQVVYNNNSNTVAVTGLTASTTYWFRVYEYNGSGASTKYLTSTGTNNPNSQATSAPAPLITVSTATLTGFTYVQGAGPSSEQTFTVSGTNLTHNISIAASTNYEISLTSGSGYTTPIVLTQSGGTVVSTTIYVRLKAGLSAGSYNSEVITATSTGASDKTVTCSGSVTIPPPSGYFVDFEGTGETKTVYGSGTVTLSGLSWDMTEVLIGTDAADWKNGSRSARMRGYGTSAMTMTANKIGGAGIISFSYRRYGTDSQVDWKVEYSTNDGTNWTQIGSVFTAPSTDVVQVFSEELNIASNMRIRIKRHTETGATNARLNIDDISITHFSNPTFTGSGNWTETARWSTGVVPGSAANVIIDGTATINTDIEVTDLTINATRSLTIDENGKLKVSGNLTNSGTLTIKSDNTGTGSLIHGNSGVNATVERYFAGSEQWRLTSSPVVNQTILDINNWTPVGTYENGHGYDFYAWHETSSTWLNQKVSANNITHFTPGIGYLVSFQASNQTKNFSGELNVGNVNVTVTRMSSGAYSGANLIGNPYASGIDWNLANRVLFNDDFAYVYDRTTNEEGLTEGYLPVDGDSPNAFIAAHQGFFVIKKDNGSSTFTFTDAMKRHGGVFTKKLSTDNNLELSLSTGSYLDKTTLRLREDASFDRDRSDAVKMFSYNSHMPQIFSQTANNVQVAINSIPQINENAMISLGVVIPQQTGHHTIKLNNAGEAFKSYSIYLEDLSTGTQHNLSETPAYHFHSASGTFTNRFKLYFGALSVNEKPTLPSLQAHVAAGQLHVFNLKGAVQLEIYDLAGRRLQQHSIMADGTYTRPLALPAGVYVVRATSEQSSKAVKVIVQ